MTPARAPLESVIKITHGSSREKEIENTVSENAWTVIRNESYQDLGAPFVPGTSFVRGQHFPTPYMDSGNIMYGLSLSGMPSSEKFRPRKI